MNAPRTLFEKIWEEHVILRSPEGEELLSVDRNLIHEAGSFLAFDQLRLDGRAVRRPGQNLAVTDHYVSALNRAAGIGGIPRGLGEWRIIAGQRR